MPQGNSAVRPTNGLYLYSNIDLMPVPIAARSKGQVYGRSPAGIVGSNPTGDMYVCCECCVLSRRGLCDELITRPEESYRLWRVVVCDLETSKEGIKSPLKGCEYKPTMGCDVERKKNCRNISTIYIYISRLASNEIF